MGGSSRVRRVGLGALLLAPACAFDSSGTGSAVSGVRTGGAVDGSTSDSTDESRTESNDGSMSASRGGSTGDTSEAGTEGGHGDSTGATSTDGAEAMPWCDATVDGLVACFDFQDIGGGLLLDGSMHGNDGTVENVGSTTGPLGNAITFGPDSKVEVPDDASLNLTYEMTLEVWIRVDALPESSRMGVLDNDGQYSIFLYADGGLRCSGSGNWLFFDPVPTSTWLHVACVIGDDAHRMYVDGELIEERTDFSGPMNTSNTHPMAIGDDSPHFDQPLAGAIGGVRVWSRPLDHVEVCEAAGGGCAGR